MRPSIFIFILAVFGCKGSGDDGGQFSQAKENSDTTLTSNKSLASAEPGKAVSAAQSATIAPISETSEDLTKSVEVETNEAPSYSDESNVEQNSKLPINPDILSQNPINSDGNQTHAASDVPTPTPTALSIPIVTSTSTATPNRSMLGVARLKILINGLAKAASPSNVVRLNDSVTFRYDNESTVIERYQFVLYKDCIFGKILQPWSSQAVLATPLVIDATMRSSCLSIGLWKRQTPDNGPQLIATDDEESVLLVIEP